MFGCLLTLSHDHHWESVNGCILLPISIWFTETVSPWIKFPLMNSSRFLLLQTASLMPGKEWWPIKVFSHRELLREEIIPDECDTAAALSTNWLKLFNLDCMSASVDVCLRCRCDKVSLLCRHLCFILYSFSLFATKEILTAVQRLDSVVPDSPPAAGNWCHVTWYFQPFHWFTGRWTQRRI